MPDLERSLATPMGEVLEAAIGYDSDIQLGMPPRPDEITHEEYEALMAIHWARARRKEELDEEARQAAESAARAQRRGR